MDGTLCVLEVISANLDCNTVECKTFARKPPKTVCARFYGPSLHKTLKLDSKPDQRIQIFSLKISQRRLNTL